MCRSISLRLPWRGWPEAAGFDQPARSPASDAGDLSSLAANHGSNGGRDCSELRIHAAAPGARRKGAVRLSAFCYNGVDTRIFRPAPRVENPALADASVVIGVVCALRPEKGLGTLVAAFAGIAREHAGAKLLIVEAARSCNGCGRWRKSWAWRVNACLFRRRARFRNGCGKSTSSFCLLSQRHFRTR